MTALELFTRLRQWGVVLTPTCHAGDVLPGKETAGKPLVFGLHIDARQGVLTDALRLAIREHKAALLDLVEEFEERAAIVEYGAGLSRATAEAFAWDYLRTQEAQEVSYGQ